MTHLQLDVEPAMQLALSLFAGERPARISVALTPDGRRALFVGSPQGSPYVSQVYERSLDRGDAVPLAGSAGATALFLSPDGQSVAFVADNKIKKMPVGGGAVAAVCDLSAGPFWGASCTRTAAMPPFCPSSRNTSTLIRTPPAGRKG